MDEPTENRSRSSFSTTKWTVVIEAIQRGDRETAAKALNDFCLQYRPAIYNFILRRGYSPETADDLTQGFFTSRILEKWENQESFVHKADRRGKFRSYLSQVVIRFLQDKTKAGNTVKGGREFEHVSSEVLTEGGHELPGSSDPDQERHFDIAWAATVITLATANLNHAQHHLDVLTERKTPAEIAKALGMSIETFRVSHHRFRERFGEAIRGVVKNTVTDGDDVIDEEIRYLMSLFDRAV